jgi:hypothetical protein
MNWIHCLDTKKRVKIADANAIFGFMPGAAMTASQSSAIDKDSTKPKRDNSILPGMHLFYV